MSAIASQLNLIEYREWIEDVGSGESNINFTVISTYKGHITSQLFKDGVNTLAGFHPMLRTTFKVIDLVPSFHELNPLHIPIREYSYNGQDHWRSASKRDLRERFSKDYEPLWRVSFLKGESEGQILLTFHHAIADGVCGVELMNHLYKILSAKMTSRTPEIDFNPQLPPLENLDRLIKMEIPPLEKAKLSEPCPKKLYSDFVMQVADEALTEKIIKWSKSHNIKVNSILFTAFMQALKTVRKLPFDEFVALTVVNFRPYFDPPVSKELFKTLFVSLINNININEGRSFIEIATELNAVLHKKLQDGEHVANLKKQEARLAQKPLPEDLILESKAPPNFAAVTNVGIVSFDGRYECQDLSMKEIFFVPNVDPFFNHPHNALLSVTTFQNRIYLAVIFCEELFSEEDANKVLHQLKSNLSEICRL